MGTKAQTRMMPAHSLQVNSARMYCLLREGRQSGVGEKKRRTSEESEE